MILQPTHYARFWGIPCYWESVTRTLWTRHWWGDVALTLAVAWLVAVCCLGAALWPGRRVPRWPIELEEEYEEEC